MKIRMTTKVKITMRMKMIIRMMKMMIKMRRINYFWFSGPPNVFEQEHFGQKLLVHLQFRFLLMMIMMQVREFYEILS